MTDRLAPPTRYEMLLAAEKAVNRQMMQAVVEGDGELLARLVRWSRELAADTVEHEQQMLGLWRLTRSEEAANAQ